MTKPSSSRQLVTTSSTPIPTSVPNRDDPGTAKSATTSASPLEVPPSAAHLVAPSGQPALWIAASRAPVKTVRVQKVVHANVVHEAVCGGACTPLQALRSFSDAIEGDAAAKSGWGASAPQIDPFQVRPIGGLSNSQVKDWPKVVICGCSRPW